VTAALGVIPINGDTDGVAVACVGVIVSGTLEGVSTTPSTDGDEDGVVLGWPEHEGDSLLTSVFPAEEGGQE
jgi:hypothetical protein